MRYLILKKISFKNITDRKSKEYFIRLKVLRVGVRF